MDSLIKKISKSDQKIARSSIELLAKSEKRLIKNKSTVVSLIIEGSDEEIKIPLKALKLLKSIVDNMASGKSIALLATDAAISTQQAADILKVSRPHLVKILEEGKIPFKKVGSHRRIYLDDIIKYQIQFKSKRRKALNSLAKEAQDLNLGY